MNLWLFFQNRVIFQKQKPAGGNTTKESWIWVFFFTNYGHFFKIRSFFKKKTAGGIPPKNLELGWFPRGLFWLPSDLFRLPRDLLSITYQIPIYIPIHIYTYIYIIYIYIPIYSYIYIYIYIYSYIFLYIYYLYIFLYIYLGAQGAHLCIRVAVETLAAVSGSRFWQIQGKVPHGIPLSNLTS